MAAAFNAIPDRTFLGFDGNKPNTGMNRQFIIDNLLFVRYYQRMDDFFLYFIYLRCKSW